MANVFVSHSSADGEFSRRLGEWLMERGHSVFLDFHHDAGIDPGLDWEQKLYDELRACQAVLVICTRNSMESRWCFAEITHARSMGKHLFPLKFAECDIVGVLSDTQILDFTRLAEAEAWGRLERGLEVAGVTAGSPFERDPTRPLYPGLLSYQAADAPIFFGRDAEISNGIDVLNRAHRFSGSGLILTLGASGSGKSSLVRAGIVPRLEPDTRSWLVVDPFRPGDDPFGNLAAAIATTLERHALQLDAPAAGAEELRGRLTGSSEPSTPEKPRAAAPGGRSENLDRLIAAMEMLMESPPRGTEQAAMQRLRTSLREWRRVRAELGEQKQHRSAPSGGTPLRRVATEMLDDLGRDREEARVLFVVDQFEELLDRGKGHPARDFLALLRATVEDRDSPVIVLGTMRSDYLAAFQSEPTLIGLGFSEILIGPMSRTALRDVIVEPAALVGESFAPALVDRLLDDAGSRDTLPLLAFTLRKLYEDFTEQKRRPRGGTGSRVGAPRGPQIEETHYDTIGGLRGSVGAVATELRAATKLTAGQDAALRSAFVGHLARFNEQGQPVRRVARWRDLPKSIHAVLQAFVAARLLVSGQEEGEPTLEVAHETLFDSWAELREWLDTNREFLLWRRRLAGEVAEWNRVGKKSSALLTGPALVEAQSWYRRSRELLDDNNQDFIRRSLTRRRNRTIVSTVTVVAVIAGISLFWQRAELARARAERQAARVLAVQAMTLRHERTDLALLVALEAHHRAPTFESESSLLSMLSENAQLKAILYRYGVLASSVAFSPDGKLFASGSDSKLVVVQDSQGEVVQSVEVFNQAVRSVAFADDGELLVAQTPHEVLTWKLRATPKPLVEPGTSEFTAMDAHPHRALVALGRSDGSVQLVEVGGALNELGKHQGGVFALAFDAAGERLVSGGNDGAVQLWNVNTGILERRLSAPTASPVHAAAFSPDGLHTATGDASGAIRIFDLNSASGATHSFDGNQGAVAALAFDRDGELYSGGEDGTIRRWTLDGRSLGVLGSSPGGIKSVDVSADGATLLSTGFDGTVRAWSLDVLPPVVDLGQKAVSAVAFHVAQAIAASGANGGSLRLWDLQRGELRKELEGHKANILSVAFSPDGRWLASGDAANEVRIWTTKTGELATTLDDDVAGKVGAVWSLAFDDGGERLAVGYDSGRTHVFDFSPPALESAIVFPEVLPEGVERVRALAFGPKNRLAHGSGSILSVFDLAAIDHAAGAPPRRILEPGCQERGVLSVAFDETGGTVFAGCANGQIKAWNLDNSDVVRDLLIGHAGEVRGLAFANGLLASASRDQTIRLWDVVPDAAIEKRLELIGHGDKVHAVTFTDGALWSGSGDGTIRRWTLDVDLDDAVCRRVQRNLTRDEWGDHFGAIWRFRLTCPDYPAGPEAADSTVPTDMP